MSYEIIDIEQIKGLSSLLSSLEGNINTENTDVVAKAFTAKGYTTPYSGSLSGHKTKIASITVDTIYSFGLVVFEIISKSKYSPSYGKFLLQLNTQGSLDTQPIVTLILLEGNNFDAKNINAVLTSVGDNPNTIEVHFSQDSYSIYSIVPLYYSNSTKPTFYDNQPLTEDLPEGVVYKSDTNFGQEFMTSSSTDMTQGYWTSFATIDLQGGDYAQSTFIFDVLTGSGNDSVNYSRVFCNCKLNPKPTDSPLVDISFLNNKNMTKEQIVAILTYQDSSKLTLTFFIKILDAWKNYIIKPFFQKSGSSLYPIYLVSTGLSQNLPLGTQFVSKYADINSTNIYTDNLQDISGEGINVKSTLNDGTGNGFTLNNKCLVQKNNANTTFTGSTSGLLTIKTLDGTYNGHLADLAFTSDVANYPIARVACEVTGNGTNLLFGTSNNYGSGITNTALKIDYSGNTTITGNLTLNGKFDSSTFGFSASTQFISVIATDIAINGGTKTYTLTLPSISCGGIIRVQYNWLLAGTLSQKGSRVVEYDFYMYDNGLNNTRNVIREVGTFTNVIDSLSAVGSNNQLILTITNNNVDVGYSMNFGHVKITADINNTMGVIIA